MPTEYIDNESVKVQLAQHFRENWDYATHMKRVQFTRYLASLAVDYIQSRYGGKLPG